MFDGVLDAVFHALTWSIQKREIFETTISDKPLCRVVDGALFVMGREVLVAELVARAAILDDEAA